MTQQFRNVFAPGLRPPQVVVHDNDGIFGDWISDVPQEFETKSLPIPLGQPWWNGCVERFHRSFKFEVLYRLPIVDEEHVRDLCIGYQRYYNKRRTHQGINGRIPKRVTGHKLVLNSNPDQLKIKKMKSVENLITVFCLAG